MRAIFAAFAVLCALLVTDGARANSFVFVKSKVVAEVPTNWWVKNSGENVTFSTQDKQVAISLAWAGRDLDRAWQILVREVDKVVSGVTVTKKRGKTGAFAGFVGTCEGKLGKTPVRCYLSVVMTPGGAMTIFLLHPIGKDKPHKAAIAQFLDGLAPVGGNVKKKR